MPGNRVVIDTNSVVSGLLWFGPPRQILDRARTGDFIAFTSNELLLELDDVLHRPKLQARLAAVGARATEMVVRFAKLAHVVQPAVMEDPVAADPDDDSVLACAVAANADYVVSGDHHLLELRDYRGIPVVRPATLLSILPTVEAP